MYGNYNSDDRFRNFEFIVYPDSATEDWKDFLKAIHVPVFISPLHDKDKWTRDDIIRHPDKKVGELKKPHYHVMLMFDGVKRPHAVYESFVRPILGVGYTDHDFDPEPDIAGIVNSKVGYARYLCHMDNPEKAPYSPADVEQYGGADYMFACNLPKDSVESLKGITEFINRNQVPSYALLMNWLMENKSDWFLVASTHTLYLTQYIKSSYWSDAHLDPAFYNIDDWS